MLKKLTQSFEFPFLIILFLLLSGISFYHADQSISVIKYHLQWGIKNLLVNYGLYHSYIKGFLFQTASFHPGSSESEWRTAFYLLPLFVFCDLLGGLSLLNICYFTILASLGMVVLFYCWIRKNWGKEAAFWGSLFFGFSAMFQEIARSGSYDAYSMLIGMIWIILFYQLARIATPLVYGALGIFTGFSWYGYSLIRTLILAVFTEIVLSARNKWAAAFLFFAGMMIFLIPGELILLKQIHDYHGPIQHLYIDRENIFSEAQGNVQEFFMILMTNFKVFIGRFLGTEQFIEPGLKNRFHAHFWHPLLVLPMILGIRRIFLAIKEQKNRLLAVLSFVIFVTPFFTSEIGYLEARRSLLYIIPAYCFIGIGFKEIIEWISGVKAGAARWLMIVLLIGGILYVGITEMDFINKRIINEQRDLGLIDFSNKIKEIKRCSQMYYLEIDGQSVYRYAYESDILRVLLMEHGHKILKIYSGDTNAKLTDIKGEFYAVESPEITEKSFESWCERNQLICGEPILVMPLKNRPNYLHVFSPFKLYIVQNRTG